MKVMFPRNIDKGLFTMNLQIGPLTISITQLLICAAGVGAALAIFNAVSAAGGRLVWGILALPVFIVFIVIAFFEVSEMGLVQYTAKMVRTFFLDTPKKFQTNFPHIHPSEIAIKKSKSVEHKQTIEIKDDLMDKQKLKEIDEKSLF